MWKRAICTYVEGLCVLLLVGLSPETLCASARRLSVQWDILCSSLALFFLVFFLVLPYPAVPFSITHHLRWCCSNSCFFFLFFPCVVWRRTSLPVVADMLEIQYVVFSLVCLQNSRFAKSQLWLCPVLFIFFSSTFSL